ncbi:RAD18 (YCR066W) [Zygosaccharomyces parabailii]|nr:RAD18 (YCR066W) [Zygosaccharomyces parabailii]CDH10982.1 related to Postreplication repair E3 ubiquitin-protein ligase RAD18 [Zygosaccharomyces bailii ISA1307]
MTLKVTDPTDFRQTAIPQLAQLDTLVRCHICKDFLKVPVLTPCCHTFCSLCIREYLTREPKCPLCLNDLRESSLRSEFLVNEIIGSFKSVRKALLESLESVKTNTEDPSLIELSDEEDDLQILATHENGTTQRGKAETKHGKISKSTTTTAESLLNTQRSKSKAREQLAQCPICQDFYPIQLLERSHLDECLTLQTLDNSRPRKRTPPRTNVIQRSLPVASTLMMASKRPVSDKLEVSHVDNYLSSLNTSNRRERLPKVNFASMSVTQIKQKLASLDLPTHGAKQNMIARYNHYEILWNSNFCDSIDPLDESELRRQLISWEASHNTSNGNTSSGNTISTMMRRANQSNSYEKLLRDFKTDHFQRKSWIRMFSKHFKSLTDEARSSIPKGGQTSIEDNSSKKDISPESVEKT